MQQYTTVLVVVLVLAVMVAAGAIGYSLAGAVDGRAEQVESLSACEDAAYVAAEAMYLSRESTNLALEVAEYAYQDDHLSILPLLDEIDENTYEIGDLWEQYEQYTAECGVGR